MSNLFISYKREDEKRVGWIHKALKDAGIDVWWDQDIAGGDHWRQSIMAKLDAASCVLVVWSRASTGSQSEFVHDEAERAKKRGTLLQIRIDNVDLPLGFGEFQALDLLRWKGDATDPNFQSVLSAVKAIIDGRALPVSASARAPHPAARRNKIAPAGTSAPYENTPGLWNETIGRKAEVEHICEMLSAARMVTITGPGGSGKTRVAIEVANQVRTRFERGVLFVDLSSLAPAKDEETLVPSRIATVAGVREQVGKPPTDVLAEQFVHGNLLIFLDNCEHLSGSCAAVAAFLISRCPSLRIMATSRTPLGHAAERVFPLGPLRIPDSANGIDAGDAMRSPAVQLFVKRVQLRSPEYRLNASDAPAVVEICRALDGLPLAIEVAVASMTVSSVDELSRNSRQLVEFLGEIKSGELRHWDSLTAALKWSCDLLGPDELPFMKTLSVFDGGWTVDAAAAVSGAAGSKVNTARQHLHRLHEHSLIFSSDWKGSKRFRFFEPIRQFIQSQTIQAERKRHQRSHARYFVDLFEKHTSRLLEKDQAEALDLIQVEADNLRAGIRWAISNNDAETGLRLLAATWRFCEIRGYLTEGRERARDILGMKGTRAFPSLRSQVLSGAGILAYRQGDYEAARPLFEESHQLELSLDNLPGVANALSDLALIAGAAGDAVRERELHSESLLIERKLGNKRQIAVLLNNMGSAAIAAGDNERASEMLRESVALFQKAENLRDCAFALKNLADVAILVGDFQAARLHAEESLLIRRERSDMRGIADALRTIARLQIETGELTEARQALIDSLRTARGLRDENGSVQCVDLFASLALKLGDVRRAVRLYAATATERKRHAGIFSRTRAWLDRDLSAALVALGETEYQRVWEEGNRISLRDAIETAGEMGKSATQLP